MRCGLRCGSGGKREGETLLLMDSTPHSQALGDVVRCQLLCMEWASDSESSAAGGDALPCSGDPAYEVPAKLSAGPLLLQFCVCCMAKL